MTLCLVMSAVGVRCMFVSDVMLCLVMCSWCEVLVCVFYVIFGNVQLV